MAKRLIVCSDGTWDRWRKPYSTNVVRMDKAMPRVAPDGTHQVVFYDAGVGTGNWWDRILGGMFGTGLDKNVLDGYQFLVRNYQDGDAIYLFGFSRGAFTVRSLAGLIRKSGLLRREHAGMARAAYQFYRRKDLHPDSDQAKQFRAQVSREVEVQFLGVWDTVGALGIPFGPLRFLTRGRYQFHDVELSRYVRNGFHALAIDERRRPFKPSLWAEKQKPGQNVEQVWFAGVHRDVGGGMAESDLPDVTLRWMAHKAEQCGLALNDKLLPKEPDRGGVLHDSMTWYYWLMVPVTRRLGQKGLNQYIHRSAEQRFADQALNYHPENVRDYLADPNHRVAYF